MTQVDLGLTNVSRFDSADSAISANDAHLKPGASHMRVAINWALDVCVLQPVVSEGECGRSQGTEESLALATTSGERAEGQC
jgi:hypothetical protein